MKQQLPTILTRASWPVMLTCALLTGCFMESAIPLSPIEQASYPDDLIDSWVMIHNENAVDVIEKLDEHQVKITFTGKPPKQNNGIISHGHISIIDGETYFNNKSHEKGRYEFYKFTRPCPDLILLYLPNPDLIDKDIKSGRLKGKIKQDFFTYRIIEEDRNGLIQYIKSYKGKLFVPFRYMVRKSKTGKLPGECKLIKYPGVPISNKKPE